jgi:transcriptional regulator with XRE-family HTH domain
MELTQTAKELTADIGKKIRDYRYENRLTLDALAEKAGVSTVLLSQFEKNELENTSLKKIIGVANAIGCKIGITLTDIHIEVPAE